MKKKLTVFLTLAVLVLMLFGTVGSFADSYTYSIDGNAQASPDAYTFTDDIFSTDMGLTTALNGPTDIETDDAGNVYIADPKNNRIVVLDEYYKFLFEISTFSNDLGGGDDSLNGCQGVFVWEGLEVGEGGALHAGKHIYVADTNNARIVVFDAKGNYERIIGEPSSDIFDDTNEYNPTALAVDSTGRIFVVAPGIYQGIVALSSDGTFEQFLDDDKRFLLHA